MQLKITALSPIHIGNGKELEPFDYYIDASYLRVMNHEACLDALYKEDPAHVTRFSAWVEETAGKIYNAESEAAEARSKRDHRSIQDKNQIISRLRREFNIITFTESVLNNPDMAALFRQDQQFHRYSAYCSERPKNVTRLKEMIKTNGRIYIPGSSIKGTIRTALAFTLIKNLSSEETDTLLSFSGNRLDSINDSVNKIISQSKSALSALENKDNEGYARMIREANNQRKKAEKRIAGNIEQYLFGCDDGRGKLDDPKFDLMRLIRVSDTTDANARMLVSEMKVFKFDRKFEKMGGQPIALAEFIDTQSEFAFRIEVDTPLIRHLFDKYQGSGWGHFAEKFTRLFKLNRLELENATNEEIEKKIIDRILAAINQFGQAIKDKEIYWLKQFGQKECSELEQFLHKLNPRESYSKIGFGSGWFATTIGLAFMTNPERSNLVKNLLYAFNLDLIIKDHNLLKKRYLHAKDKQRVIKLLRRSPDSAAFPKSRRLVAERRTPVDYIGWFRIEYGSISKKKPEYMKNDEVESKNSDKSLNFEEKLNILKDKFNA